MRLPTRRLLLRGGLLLAVALLAIPLAARAADTIKIGVAGPMTGPVAKFGEQFMKGATQAVHDMNLKGGVLGHRLELVVGDDACDPKQAQTVANSLVDSQVYAVVGHFCSASTIPASVVYAENNLLMISPASTNPLVTERNLPTVLRLCGRDDQQGDVAADYIAGTLRAQRIAVVHDKTTYGQGLADATRNRLHGKYHVQEVLYEGINQGDKDFNSLITKMKGLKVDAIFFGGYHTEAGLIVRQAYEQGLKARFVSGDAMVTEEFPSVVGKPEAVLGVLMTFGADPSQIPSAKPVVVEFEKSGYNPEGYTLYTYATFQVIAEALRATNLSRDGKVLADYIKAHTFDTIMGPKAFDAKGDLKISDYVVYEWVRGKDGKLTYRQL